MITADEQSACVASDGLEFDQARVDDLAGRFRPDKGTLRSLDSLTRLDAVWLADGVSEAHAQKLEQAGDRLCIVETAAA